MKLTIIIPVFNEKNTILNLLNLIEKQDSIKKQILLVDDKSTDDSLDKIKSFNFKSDFTIIEHTINKGKGACIKTAKKHINGDIVLIQDADLEYSPDDYLDLIKPIIQKKN